MIGREHDLTEIMRRLEGGRLVTLTGLGGSGKTRLARAVVDAIRARGRSAWFIDASRVLASDALPGAIVVGMQIEAAASRDPFDVVVDTLGDRDVALAVDNVEQIPGVGGILKELVASAPGLRLLMTSRVPLGEQGEVEYPVRALELPADDSVAAIEQSAAGSLLLERARSIHRMATLDPATVPALAELLRCLDGMPLAIELAAARLRVMTPAQMVDRLRRHGTAALGPGEGGERRSVEAILRWTRGLLSVEQAHVLDAVSVCADFDLALAEALVPEADALGALESLATIGLVEPTGELGDRMRFHLPETVRGEVARGISDDERDRFRSRHARRMIELAGALARRAAADGAIDLLGNLDADADNFRVALDWLDATDPVASLALWDSLAPLWDSRNRLKEGIRRFEHTSALASEPTRQLAAAMTKYAGFVADVHGVASARETNRRALDVATTVGDRRSMIHALTSLAYAAIYDADSAAAQEAAAAIAGLERPDDDVNERLLVAQARYAIASAREGMSSAAAMVALADVVELAVTARRPAFELAAAGNLAIAHLYREEPALARPFADRAVELAQQLRHRWLAWALGLKAMALAGLGQSDAARAVLADAIRETVDLKVPEQTADTIRAAMSVSVASRHPLLAARLWGATLALERAGVVAVASDDRELADRTLARVRRRCREIDVVLALRDGEASDPLDVLVEAEHALEAPSRGSEASGRMRHGELTRREIEVLGMIGAGRSDPEIAEALFISPKTASVHAANIKAKLGLSSRLEVALRARELGIDPPQDAGPSSPSRGLPA
ncbi:MAG: hypothetical protein A2V85_11760 [Chloroflexi bacterium RBG_16_72_14]|nr:MAG: hypothetical protein A2V85_11760 [Chloroflexi bacterium RBG_16_72_14]